MDNRLKEVLEYFPHTIKDNLFNQFNNVGQDIQEIRLRVNKPICITLSGENHIIDKERYVNQSLIDEVFSNICEHSVYTYQNDINNGFVTIKGGHRVGVCGSAVLSKGEIVSVKNISSLNFRIARQYTDCARPIVNDLSHNYLLVGPPSSGKTTLLRDMARIISENGKKVCIIDERNEIAGNNSGYFNTGIMTDCLCGYKKAEGINIAIRTLSPQVIIFDEIGTDEEYERVKECLNCGVDIITSVHAYSKQEFYSRSFCKKILKSEFFDTFVFLGRKPGVIDEQIRKCGLIETCTSQRKDWL